MHHLVQSLIKHADDDNAYETYAGEWLQDLLLPKLSEMFQHLRIFLEIMKIFKTFNRLSSFQ